MASSMSFFRLPSSTAGRGAIAALSVAGIAAVVMTVIDLNKSDRKSPIPKSKCDMPRSLRQPFFAADGKHWPKPTFIATSTHSPIQRGQNLVGWYDEETDVGKVLELRGIKEHSTVVEKYLDAQFYLHIPRSLGAPLHLDFDVAPRLVEDVGHDIHGVCMEDLVLRQLGHITPRTQRLLLTQSEHCHTNKPTKFVHRQAVLINAPDTELLVFLQLHQWNSRLLSDLISTTTYGLIEHFSFDIDFRILLACSIPPPGFASCMIDSDVVPLGPHEEPQYISKKSFRAHAPRPTEDLKQRFAAASAASRPCVPVDYQNLSVGKATILTQSSYHEGVKATAVVAKERAERGNSYGVSQGGPPEAAEYLLHHAFSEAWEYEMRAKRLQQVPEAQRPRYLEENAKEFADLYQQYQEAESYWMAHPDEYKRCFSLSGSSSGRQQSPFTPVSEVSCGYDEYNQQWAQECGQHYEDYAAVLDDPAIIYAVVKRASFSKPAPARVTAVNPRSTGVESGKESSFAFEKILETLTAGQNHDAPMRGDPLPTALHPPLSRHHNERAYNTYQNRGYISQQGLGTQYPPSRLEFPAQQQQRQYAVPQHQPAPYYNNFYAGYQQDFNHGQWRVHQHAAPRFHQPFAYSSCGSQYQHQPPAYMDRFQWQPSQVAQPRQPVPNPNAAVLLQLFRS